MRSYVTSYNGLFLHADPESSVVARIEIPLIQRDFAQGRDGDAVKRIRSGFLDVLHAAVTGGEPVGLDFVFGDVEGGSLRPLDGQQRLTTLFLLHWYLASRAGRLDQEQGWKNFAYATRPGARLFCQELARTPLPQDAVSPKTWIVDQPWYLYTWCHDPTVQSMLVMLDAMHERFDADDCVAAWERLVDRHRPAITFHLLPIEDLGPSEDLYIKMNSRGKPLTPFENFKARFLQTLEATSPAEAARFAAQADTAWSDVLWPYRGADNLIDDEFMRYFQFVSETCAWRSGDLPDADTETLAARIFGASPHAQENLDFLFYAFDTWIGADVPATFSALFRAGTAPSVGTTDEKLLLFGKADNGIGVDLFAACCGTYGQRKGKNRVFGLGDTLLLYAVLLQRRHGSQEFSARMRILRNLAEASGNELREDRMPGHVEEVRRIIVTGSLDGVSTFNPGQVADERLKAGFLAAHPVLRPVLVQLEDHRTLRGCLHAFEFDEGTFDVRAGTFLHLLSDPGCWLELTGALLACGDYFRRRNSRSFQFGSGTNQGAWRDLLTGATRDEIRGTRQVLEVLLDRVSQPGGDAIATLPSIVQQRLDATDPANGFDWRWYLLKYPVMRTGASGIYVAAGGELGYDLCMLNGTKLSGSYRDPYLLAIHRLSGVGAAAADPWFSGYETKPRYLELAQSGTGLRCIPDGFEIRPPLAPQRAAALDGVRTSLGIGTDDVVRIPQVERAGLRFDACDRVEVGAALLRALLDAGL